MFNYTYTCPVCHNEMTLTMDMESCPFQRTLAGQCDKCNNKVEILEDYYKEREEAKSNGS